MQRQRRTPPSDRYDEARIVILCHGWMSLRFQPNPWCLCPACSSYKMCYTNSKPNDNRPRRRKGPKSCGEASPVVEDS